MATYLSSDQHISLRYPERGLRFARFLDQLDPKSDSLIIAGDLCDFWFTAREVRKQGSRQEPGLQGLLNFVNQGGRLTMLAGNHDQHLEWFYQELLGCQFEKEPLRIALEGFQVHLAHGHLLGGRSRWKGWMESRQFLESFQKIPDSIAETLAAQLKKYNSRNKKTDNLRHYQVFERYVQNLNEPDTQIVILGHVHQTIFCDVAPAELDLQSHAHNAGQKKMAVLGHWFHQGSWLRLEDQKADFYIWQDSQDRPERVTDQRIAGPLAMQ
ncbi:MAG: UDP-2,3-diacylglucosamine hydrolase [Planctomycetota bacterium]